MNGLRWFVRSVLIFGLAVSVWANVLDADPHPISMVLSGLAPFAMFLALEMATRLPLSQGTPREHRIAYGRFALTCLIAAIAAVISYGHMVGTALKYGQPEYAAHLLPIAIDGLIVVATINLFELAPKPKVFGAIPKPGTAHIPEPEPGVSVSATPQSEPVPEPDHAAELAGMAAVDAMAYAHGASGLNSAAALRSWLAARNYRLSRDAAYEEFRKVRDGLVTTGNGQRRGDR